MTPLFVTGSGTGIGKTLVTAILIRQLKSAGRRVAALKPVISGYTPESHETSDTGVLQASLGTDCGDGSSVEAISPWRFKAPLSPDMAAAREGKALDLGELVGFCRKAAEGADDVLLIEGVGGVMVPLTEKETVLDWMAALGFPALLVTGSYLGTISHTLTAMAALAERAVPVRAIIVSESEESPVPLPETRGAIARFLSGTQVAALPRLAGGVPDWRAAPDLLGPARLG